MWEKELSELERQSKFEEYLSGLDSDKLSKVVSEIVKKLKDKTDNNQ